MRSPSKRPVVVLLPGTHGNAEMFGPLREAFAGWPLKVLEYPVNTGWDLESYSEWLRLQVKGLGSYILIAESFGSLVAVRFASDRPKGLKYIVTLGGLLRRRGFKIPSQPDFGLCVGPPAMLF